MPKQAAETDTKTAVKTTYVVQQRKELIERDENDLEETVVAWVDFPGTYETSGGQRAAIKMAVQEMGLQEGKFRQGKFRALSPTAATEHSPKGEWHLSWE